jgi:hypothetical protein
MKIIGFTKDGWIECEVDGTRLLVPEDMENSDRQLIAAWEDEGNTIPPFEPDIFPTITDYENAIQNLVDETAREKQFRDGVTLASYIGSTIPRWAAEAMAFVAWRDNVWRYSYGKLAKVQAGQRPQPTVEKFLDEIARIAWPVA